MQAAMESAPGAIPPPTHIASFDATTPSPPAATAAPDTTTTTDAPYPMNTSSLRQNAATDNANNNPMTNNSSSSQKNVGFDHGDDMVEGSPVQSSPPTDVTSSTNTVTTSNQNANANANRPQRGPNGGLGKRMQSVRHSIAKANVKVPKRYMQWPRLFACCFGIVIPLVLIVMISLIVGMLLGKLEMQGEIDHNDSFLRATMAELKYEDDLAMVLQQLPTLCLALLHNNETKITATLPKLLESSMTDMSILEDYLELGNRLQDTQQIPNNYTLLQMSDYFDKCGTAGGSFRAKWLANFEPLVGEKYDTMTLQFNYIRCVNRTHPLRFNMIVAPNAEDLYDAQPSTQKRFYTWSWNENQKELEAQYKTSGEMSDIDAITKSFADATGGDKCSINLPSAGTLEREDWNEFWLVSVCVAVMVGLRLFCKNMLRDDAV